MGLHRCHGRPHNHQDWVVDRPRNVRLQCRHGQWVMFKVHRRLPTGPFLDHLAAFRRHYFQCKFVTCVLIVLIDFFHLRSILGLML
ncbi:unnamed protein product [Gongylonema pulchrum]|uniref:Uncharacterized protein n=1 Tax=Gongylonema pulchrum TaxID=637853 RepID=A0A183ESC2_9BILA|nr:unnamed protein product [Gongylonema pulchrum]